MNPDSTRAKENLKSFSVKGKKTIMEELEAPDGTRVKDQGAKENIAKSFYMHLYCDTHVEQEAINKLILCAEPELEMVTDEEAEALTEPITSEDVLQEIKESPRGKAPGPDGIPAEVFKSCLDTSTQIPGGNEVNITLLYKNKGPQNLLKKQIISNHLMEIEDRVLHKEQKGFVNSRSTVSRYGESV